MMDELTLQSLLENLHLASDFFVFEKSEWSVQSIDVLIDWLIGRLKQIKCVSLSAFDNL